MSSEIQNDFLRNRFSTDSLHFYSAPTSPSKSISKPYATASTTVESYSDSDSSEFEFEASRRFLDADNELHVAFETENSFEYLSDLEQKQPRQREDSLHPMAFADDLFSDGKVLPLKLPPRLQTIAGNLSPTLSSPRSPSSPLKLPFSSCRRDDFDPFMTALESVKEGKNHKRAQSLSPLFGPIRPEPINSKDVIPTYRERAHSFSPLGSVSPYSPKENNPMSQEKRTIQVGQSPIRLVEPKGLDFARKVRLVKMGHEVPNKPIGPANSRSIIDSKSSELFRVKESKREKIKKIFFKTEPFGKEVVQKEPNTAVEKPKMVRRYSFKTKNLGRVDGDKRLGKVNRMSLVQYRPRLFLCLGYGSKGLKYVK